MAQRNLFEWACSGSDLLGAQDQKGTCYVIDTNVVSKLNINCLSIKLNLPAPQDLISAYHQAKPRRFKVGQALITLAQGVMADDRVGRIIESFRFSWWSRY